jgi:hypothetical protein
VKAFKAKGKGSSTGKPSVTLATVPEQPDQASTHATGGSYTEAETEQGLVALAVCSGNSRRAARLLADRGLPIPRSTLKQWPDLYPDQYAAVQTRILPELKARLAEEHTALAEDLMDLSREMSARLMQEYGELPVRDLPSGVRNITVASAIHTDKARDLRGDPTTVVEHRSIADIKRRLRELFQVPDDEPLIIAGEAEEIEVPAELAEGEHD